LLLARQSRRFDCPDAHAACNDWMEQKQRYVSKELMHFVGRGRSDPEQYRVLVAILTGETVSHAPHDPQT
jgi:hypothetical protein